MNCPECGATMREGASFCNQCGASLKAHEGVSQGEVPRSHLMRRVDELKWIIVLYVILSLCCCACGCLLGYRAQWILWKLGLW